MTIFPSIDLYSGKAVRLYQGDYQKITVFDDDPLHVAKAFVSAGATHLHLVDLEGARDGEPHATDLIYRIIAATGLSVEIGGGIRNEKTVRSYLESGADYVIIGTAAITDPGFLETLAGKYPGRIAVGVDLKDGFAAVRGWRETTTVSADEIFSRIITLGINRVICTDIARDGAMRGANRALYSSLIARYPVDLIASGGVSSLDDIRVLSGMGLFGAIIGKAYYTGAIDLREAVREGKA